MRRDFEGRAEAIEGAWLGGSGAIGGAFNKEAGREMTKTIAAIRNSLDSHPQEQTAESGDLFKALAGLGAKVIKL